MSSAAHPREVFHLSDGLPVLERTPAVLRALLADLPTGWADVDEGPDTWSPLVVVGHLVHGERADWIPRARLVLAQDPDARFAPFDRFAQLRESAGKTLAQLLDELTDLRAANLATVRAWNLTDRELALSAMHPDLGRVSLRQLLATWVAHDLAHLGQITRVMAKRYRAAVGPWRAYLPVMER